MSLHPFELDTNTGEPFLRLLPHDNIFLGLPRFENADAIVEILNEPTVYPYVGSPYPHTVEAANSYTKLIRQITDEIWSEIKTFGTDSGHIFGGCPVRSICEARPNGEKIYIGDFGIGRWKAPEIRDPKLREEVIRENQEKVIGDPSIIWSMGYYLKPSHHGQGIMSAIFKTVLERWAIPHMHVRHVRCTTRVDNPQSQRVLEKMGFVNLGDVQEVSQKPESKGGEKVALRLWEWHLSKDL